jgi:hypothetical protein
LTAGLKSRTKASPIESRMPPAFAATLRGRTAGGAATVVAAWRWPVGAIRRVFKDSIFAFLKLLVELGSVWLECEAVSGDEENGLGVASRGR